jgi:hypothetical protein
LQRSNAGSDGACDALLAIEVRQRRAAESAFDVKDNRIQVAVAPVLAAFAARHVRPDQGNGSPAQQSRTKRPDRRNRAPTQPPVTAQTCSARCKGKTAYFLAINWIHFNQVATRPGRSNIGFPVTATERVGRSMR